MSKKCGFSMEVANRVFICKKYGDYCLLDFPDKQQCDKIYDENEDYNIQEAEYEESNFGTDDALE